MWAQGLKLWLELIHGSSMEYASTPTLEQLPAIPPILVDSPPFPRQNPGSVSRKNKNATRNARIAIFVTQG